MNKLNKKSILVVGASGSIGAQVALQLGLSGYAVGLHFCNNRAAVDDLSHKLKDAGARSFILQSQLSCFEECDELVLRFNELCENFYGIAICSGRVPWKHWSDTTQLHWVESYFEHCAAPFALARASVKMFSEGGRIVYLSSISPKYGGSDRTLHYAAAKAGLEVMMKGLSRELAQSGIRVNGVRAGFVDTPQQRAGRTEAEMNARIARIPLRRPGTSKEVASAFSYLFSEEAAFITSEIITVAGGD